MVAELRTVVEIAGELRLPESTVRYYRDRFVAYVPWSAATARAATRLRASPSCGVLRSYCGQGNRSTRWRLTWRSQVPLAATTAPERNGVDRTAVTQQQQRSSNATQPTAMVPDV